MAELEFGYGLPFYFRMLTDYWMHIPAGRVADIGCSEGDVSVFLARMRPGELVIDAVDKDENVLTSLRQATMDENLPIHIHNCDITDFPLEEKKYQGVIVTFILNAKSDDLTFFETQMNRMIEAIVPGGYFFPRVAMMCTGEEAVADPDFWPQNNLSKLLEAGGKLDRVFECQDNYPLGRIYKKDFPCVYWIWHPVFRRI